MPAIDPQKIKINEKEMKIHREYMRRFQKKLPRTASHSDIRQAYRKLALQYHPDRNRTSNSEQAQQKWEGVATAYAVLSDPNDRAAYDATLSTRDALVEFYKTYNPAKLSNATIENIVGNWKGRELELFHLLKAKYEIAPHQGIDGRMSNNCLTDELSSTIRRDSAGSHHKEAEMSSFHNWGASISSAFCCKSLMSKLASSTYYEVHTKSPGMMNVPNMSGTPGQGPRPIHTPGCTIPPVKTPGAPRRNSSTCTWSDDEKDEEGFRAEPDVEVYRQEDLGVELTLSTRPKTPKQNGFAHLPTPVTRA